MNAFILVLVAIVFYLGVANTDRETGIIILMLGSTLFLLIPLVVFLLERRKNSNPKQRCE